MLTRAAKKKLEQPIMTFHTTSDMEALLKEEHSQKVKEQAKKMVGQRTKYTAGTIVGCRAMPFLVDNGVVTLCNRTVLRTEV